MKGLKKHSLNMHQRVKIIDLLRANRERYAAERPSLALVAEEMSKQVGAPVSPSSVHALRRSCGVDWKPAFTRNANATPGLGVKARLSVLEDAVALLLQQLGIATPPEWNGHYKGDQPCQPTAAGGPAGTPANPKPR